MKSGAILHAELAIQRCHNVCMRGVVVALADLRGDLFLPSRHSAGQCSTFLSVGVSGVSSDQQVPWLSICRRWNHLSARRAYPTRSRSSVEKRGAPSAR